MFDLDFYATINQYDKNSDRLIQTTTCTFPDLMANVLDAEASYFKVKLFENAPTKTIQTTHFGIQASNYGSLKISEDIYVNSFLNYMIKRHMSGDTLLSDFFHLINRDTWFTNMVEKCSKNSPISFNLWLDNFLSKHAEFVPVTNLRKYKGISGLYLLVLDEYCICYLGQSKDIKNRIVQHWGKNNYFTGTGIDLFRAKDTTRVFVCPEYSRDKINHSEYTLVNEIPSSYRLNILAGGSIDYLLSNQLSLLPVNSINGDLLSYFKQQILNVQKESSKFIVES